MRGETMKALDAIRTVLKFSDKGMTHLGGMKDAPLLRPGPWGGNHAMWIAGHLTVVEGRLQQMLHGTPNPVHQWKPLFDWGSEPVDDLAVYPPFEDVLQTFRRLREQTHAFLDKVGEDGLD
jgi:DinB superfamily